MFEQAPTRQWLSVQCRLVDASAKGVVFFGEPDSGAYAIAAVWPDDYAGNPIMAEIVKTAIARRQTLFAAGQDKTGGEIMASPLLRDGKVVGAVALELPRPANDDQRGMLVQTLNIGSAWLGQIGAPPAPPRNEHPATLLDLAATCLAAESFAAAAAALVTELATRFGCDRVSLGLLRHERVCVRALSHNAGFSQRQQLTRQLEAAMGEALQQEQSVVHPPVSGHDARIHAAHAELARWHKSGSICTVPLHYRQRLLGALTFEVDTPRAPFDADKVRLFEHCAALIGPILALRQRDDRALSALLRDAARVPLARLFGPGHLVTKLATVIAASVLLLAALLPGQYQVTADALLEGRVERVVAAPQKGFLQSVSARPGDLVKQGAALASLDDRDLKLEQLKWSAKQEQVSQEYRRALAERDRINIGVLSAQLTQAESQLALIEKQLGRVQLVAPFDGVVVAGDFTQALGLPVERGQVLFKLAPLDDYRVIIKVDEADIADVREGQRGRLTLTATPDESLEILIERITPVASADARANYFRVEAKLGRPPTYLRPGMQGVAKIDVDTRRLLWIWTRSLVNWVRLKLWSWWP